MFISVIQYLYGRQCSFSFYVKPHLSISTPVVNVILIKITSEWSFKTSIPLALLAGPPPWPPAILAATPALPAPWPPPTWAPCLPSTWAPWLPLTWAPWLPPTWAPYCCQPELPACRRRGWWVPLHPRTIPPDWSWGLWTMWPRIQKQDAASVGSQYMT